MIGVSGLRQAVPAFTDGRRVTRLRAASLLASAGILAFWPATVGAQARNAAAETQHPAGLADIVVTARRKEESLQKVPMTVAVLDAAALEQKGISNTNDLVTSVAGLSGVNFTNRTRTIYAMRGQTEAFANSQPGVVPYYAEVADFSAFIYDLQGVQVLKGPQGTLFGRNTTGGAILFTPTRPSSDLNGYIKATLGSYETRNLEFAVGAPLVEDKVSVRIAGQRLRRNGYTRNLFTGNKLDNEHRESLRLSLLLTPVDGFENYTLVQWGRVSEAGTSNVMRAFIDSPATPYQGELAAFVAAQRARGPRVVSNDADLFQKMKEKGFINATTIDLTDTLSVKNIVSHRSFITKTGADFDGAPFRIINVVATAPFYRSRSTTEELQLRYERTGISAVVGGYYEKTSSGLNHSEGQTSLPTLIDPSLPLFFVPFTVSAYSSPSSNSKAIFGQATITVVDGLSLTGGIRYTKDFRRLIARQDVTFPGTPTFTQYSADSRLKAHATTWNLAASYQVTPDVMAYGTVRRGYKTGGFNNTANVDRVTFFPEFVTSHELGVKSQFELGEVRVRLNGDIFYDRYSDIQRNLLQQSVGGVPESLVSNAASASVKGLDLELLVVPSSWFDLNVNYTYLRPKYKKFVDPTLGDLSGTRFPNTPRNQLTATASVHVPVPEHVGALNLQASLYYQSGVSFDVLNRPNGNPLTDAAVQGSNAPGYTRIDLQADWEKPFGLPFDVSAFARNVTNKTYAVGGYNLLTGLGAATLIYGAPRMYGAGLKYSF